MPLSWLLKGSAPSASTTAIGGATVAAASSIAQPIDDEWSSDGAHLPGYSNLTMLFENR
jgi:hypothetical protein